MRTGGRVSSRGACNFAPGLVFYHKLMLSFFCPLEDSPGQHEIQSACGKEEPLASVSEMRAVCVLSGNTERGELCS